MIVRDPVCGMQVQVSERTPRSTHEGKTYYFCAPGCKRAFDLAPQEYVRTQEGA